MLNKLFLLLTALLPLPWWLGSVLSRNLCGTDWDWYQ